jgi:hypothetical protein
MNESPLHSGEFAASVMAVPPLARRADHTLDPAENLALIRQVEAGGVRTLLYGGNANVYHIAVSEYRDLLDLLADAAGPDTRVIPAIGPDYGKMLDEARILAIARPWCCRSAASRLPRASRQGSRASPTRRACR